VLLVNQAATVEYGYSVEEFTQLRVDQMAAPSERSRLTEHVAGLAGTGRHLSGTWRQARRDGSEFEVEIVSHPITFDGREARILIAANVTDRVRAQRELAASEARYRLLFESNPHPMWVFDRETLRFLTVNTAAMQQYGYGEDEFLAMTIEQIRPTEDAGRVRAHLAERRQDGVRNSGVWRHLRKDGSLIDVEVVSHGITYAGRPARLVLAIDVTTRMAAEQALRDSESRYRSLFEQIPDGVAHAGADGRVIAANDAWLRMVGYAREDVGRLRIFDVLEAEESPRFDALLESARSGEASGVQKRERLRHRRRDGSHFVAEVSSRLLSDGTTLGVVHDLTGLLEVQRRIELQRDMFELLTLSSKAMARATNREELFRHVADLVVEKGDYRFAWFGEIVGDLVVPRVWSGNHDGHLDDARASISAGRSPSGGELARLLRSGTSNVIHDTASYPNLLVAEDLSHRRGIRSIAMLPVRTHGRVTHGLLVYADRGDAFDPDVVRALDEMASDVSFSIDLLAAREELAEAHAGLERKVEERTRALAEARDRAEAADRAKSVFLSSVSHELRSPLHSIMGFTSVLLEGIDGVLNDAQLEHLRIVRDASQNLLGLINDLIDISKLEAGLMSLERRPFAPAPSIRRTADACRAAAEAKGLALTVEIEDPSATVEGDEARFEQVLGKLLSNAVLYTDRGSVTLRCRRDGAHLQVVVADTGRGITEADRPRLFDRFTQFDPGEGRLRQGTGLGLAIAYGLVTEMGGTLGCVSEVDHGSTFTITLPIGGQPAAANATRRE
jgi:PAS domain S-box-containing protein